MADENLSNQNQSKKGGARPGAGRKKGSRNKATIQAKRALSELAQEHTKDALNTLVFIAKKGQSDSARVAAAVAILDRGYGRPPQSHEIAGPDGAPLRFQNVSGLTEDQLRALAAIDIDADHAG